MDSESIYHSAFAHLDAEGHGGKKNWEHLKMFTGLDVSQMADVLEIVEAGVTHETKDAFLAGAFMAWAFQKGLVSSE